MDKTLYKQLNKIINILILFFAVIILPGVGISLSRIPAIGIRPEMYFHVVLGIGVLFLAVFRRKVPYKVKAWIGVISFMLVGYSGLFSIGLSSSGRMDIVISIALACLFFDLQTGLVLAVINIIAFIFVAALNIKGLIHFNIDFNVYNHAMKSWIAAFYNYTALGIVAVLMTGLVNQQLRLALKKMYFKKKQLHKEIMRRRVTEEKYKKLSITDPLTELYNRRYLFDKGGDEMLRCDRYNRDLSVIMVDADYFKDINDTYGHKAGDLVLQKIAERLNSNLRPSDISSRFGGEEFCLLLPETDMEEALHVAERLRMSICSEPFAYEDKKIELTCSFGIAARKEGETDFSAVLSRADGALYKSKNKGRNTINT